MKRHSARPALRRFCAPGRYSRAALADQILRLLGPQPVELDEIARQCGASPAEFSLAVLELDLAGRIGLLAGGMIVNADPAA